MKLEWLYLSYWSRTFDSFPFLFFPHTHQLRFPQVILPTHTTPLPTSQIHTPTMLPTSSKGVWKWWTYDSKNTRWILIRVRLNRYKDIQSSLTRDAIKKYLSNFIHFINFHEHHHTSWSNEGNINPELG